MPKYTFRCPDCGHQVQENVFRRVNSIPCTRCSAPAMKRQMPKLGGQSQVNETVDEYTGITWKDGQRDAIKERKDKYYWEVEVPRMVNSGTYSIETMLEMGWVYFNDKDEMCVNNKPPSER